MVKEILSQENTHIFEVEKKKILNLIESGGGKKEISGIFKLGSGKYPFNPNQPQICCKYASCKYEFAFFE